MLEHMLLPTPKEIKQSLPLRPDQQQFVKNCRRSGKNLLAGDDKRLVIVAGPCSIHDRASALEYGRRFKDLAAKVSKTCFLVMRVYMEKPRTTTGWKGLLYDPHLDGSNDLNTGILWARELLLELTEMRVPIASEFVDPLAALYMEDLVSWGFIGARTSASQPHRQLASHLDMPIGFKNTPDGNIDPAVHAVVAAQNPQAFMHINEEGRLSAAQSRGNAWTHVVLRGGAESPNYDPASIAATVAKLNALQLGPRLLIDCAHGNCQKQFDRQKSVFYSVLEQIEQGNQAILGMMLESHLESGNQSLSGEISSTVSVTDGCIDWSSTEALVSWADSCLSSTGSLI
jgi:3-deoxy-7-phosphoheptulonate synthase